MTTININGTEIPIGEPGQDGFTLGPQGWFVWKGIDATNLPVTPSTANPGIIIGLDDGVEVKAPSNYAPPISNNSVIPNAQYNDKRIQYIKIPQPMTFITQRAFKGDGWVFSEYDSAKAAPPQVPLVATTPAVAPSAGAAVKLTDIIQLSTTSVERQYVKGTLKAIEVQKVMVTNISNNVEVNAAFTPRAGLIFNPSTLLIPVNSSREVILTFDLASIDALNEGLTTYNIPIALTSPTAILPVPVAPPPMAPVSQVPAPTPINYTISSVTPGQDTKFVVGQSVRYSATGEHGRSLTGPTDVNWTSSNDAIISVDGTGVASINSVGTARITATRMVNGSPYDSMIVTNSVVNVIRQLPIIEDVSPLPPTPPKSGRWELVQVAPGSTTVELIVSLNAPTNGQGPVAENGYVAGIYNTTYGYHKTTVVGPTYDYQLVGDVYAAGKKPMPPAAAITVTEDSNKYQMLTNVLVPTSSASGGASGGGAGGRSVINRLNLDNPNEAAIALSELHLT